MAGLYIHIPFCASRCIYCGFYSTTRHDLRQRYVDAVCREMEQRQFAGSQEWQLDTIYLGGGTPSQLTVQQLEQLFTSIKKVYRLSSRLDKPGEAPTKSEEGPERTGQAPQKPDHGLEVTLECNPDDITVRYAAILSQLPVNRVSMGVQTFSDARLRFLRRRHTAAQIPLAVERLRKAGIQNISIDLMYGFPQETIEDWHYDIGQALSLGVEHLSAYSLMYEEGTPLYQLIMNNEKTEHKDPRYVPIDEETELRMFNDLMDRLTDAGYEHYEISNFAKWKEENGRRKAESYRSRHNSSYWHQVPYIGLGAAAHSYDGDSRQWNVDNVEQYIEGIEHGTPFTEREELDETTKYNELIMTSLRTCEGLQLNRLDNADKLFCLQQARRYLDDGLLTLKDNCLQLSRRGIFVSNMVMSGLMRA